MNDEFAQYLGACKKNLVIVYLLYLCGIIAPLLLIIGTVFTYINKDTKDTILSSHYLFLYRTFWIGATMLLISVITTIIFVGIIIYALLFIWFIIRVGFGFRCLMNNYPHPNPLTFMIR